MLSSSSSPTPATSSTPSRRYREEKAGRGLVLEVEHPPSSPLSASLDLRKTKDENIEGEEKEGGGRVKRLSGRFAEKETERKNLEEKMMKKMKKKMPKPASTSSSTP